MFKTEVIFVNRLIFVDFDGQFNLKNNGMFLELLDKFNDQYREKAESEIEKFLRDKRDRARELTDNVDIWIYGIYKRLDVIISVCCNVRDSSELLQVFADEDIKNKIMRLAFEYI